MNDLRALFYGIAGAFRLLRFDIQGARMMVLGRRGFWGSLVWSMVLAAPFYLLLVLVQYDPASTIGWRYFVVQAETYVLAWLIFPVVMERVCVYVDRRDYFLNFIVPYNWLSCLFNLVYVLLALAQVAGLVDYLDAVSIAVFLLALGMVWMAFLARHTLLLPYSVVVGILVLDLFVSLMMNMLNSAMLLTA